MSFKPLFGSGLARSGGGLASMCLSSHKDTMVACCPNLEIFRSLRNSIVKKGSSNDLFKPISTNSPIQDWHGSDNRIKLFR